MSDRIEVKLSSGRSFTVVDCFEMVCEKLADPSRPPMIKLGDHLVATSAIESARKCERTTPRVRASEVQKSNRNDD